MCPAFDPASGTCSLARQAPRFKDLKKLLPGNFKMVVLKFVFERSIFGVELVLEPASFVCYCWRKRLDRGKIGRIQTGRASNTQQENIPKICELK